MPDVTACDSEDESLQLFRQFHDRCLEQYGEAHQQTLLVLKLISSLENNPPPMMDAASA